MGSAWARGPKGHEKYLPIEHAASAGMLTVTQGSRAVAATSIRDVADRAGVSVGTVSNVLNRPDAVAAGTRTRVQAVIQELGFVRNESARHLRAGRSRIIAFVVLDSGNPFFTDVARGVEEALTAAGLAVFLCNSDQSSTREKRYLNLLEEQRVQGVLITPVGADESGLERLRARGIPVVLLDRRASGDSCCSVSVDDVLGGRMAAEHLLNEGHQTLTFVGPTSVIQVRERLLGARSALEQMGRDPNGVQHLEVPSLTFDGGRRAAQLLLTGPQHPTAVFCANDLLALGMLQELARKGVRVPDDVALVGYDDIEFAGAAAIPLSSVRQPRHFLGRTAAELLLEEAGDGHHRHRQVLFQPELVVRTSSRRPTPATATAGLGPIPFS